MKQIITILSIIFLLFSCKYLDVQNLNLSNDEGENESVLVGVLADSPLLPPTEIQAFSVLKGNILDFHLSWDSVPFASEYEIWTGESEAGEFEKVGTSLVNSYLFSKEVIPTLVSHEQYFRIVALNRSKLASPLSKIFLVSFSKEGGKVGSVDTLYSSKGTSSSVELTWVPAENAYYYRIERAVSKSGEFEVIEDSFIPLDFSESLHLFKDREVVPGVIYDYIVTPFDRYGSGGRSSGVSVGGYVLPSVENFNVSFGSSLRGNASGDIYSVLDLQWDRREYLVDAFDSTAVEVDGWKIFTSLDQNSSGYFALEDIFLNSPLIPANVKALRKFEPTLPNVGALLSVGLDDYLQDGECPQLFSKIYQDTQTGVIYRRYKYRILVDYVTDGFEAPASSYYSFFYFKVKGVYNENFPAIYYETLESKVNRGFACDPTAQNFSKLDLGFSAIYNSASSNVGVSFNRVDGVGGIEVQKYFVYRRIAYDIAYKLVSEIEADGSASYQYSDSDLVQGSRYEYAVQVLGSDGKLSHYSEPAYIEVVQ